MAKLMVGAWPREQYAFDAQCNALLHIIDFTINEWLITIKRMVVLVLFC